ncbi:TIGR03619 family F420-dependent LLM class oxidoreductase [Nocardioides acrostichi]|uniref:TIGR03619 family F420-dependent LLM class oxidoreductase n=1 Tax=Nocardioides acrostichi TaxID=2784339 RepID=A0A930Y767_9ACTN|nr:TIGR03619 family F420-dependent LLM class oxidoreductase [Nocardioides acrostichi]MBF4161722.1 TIGR03619 family F420-dependent LLM class oxidoreductase [Nocardioides acrostichi]
MRFSINLAWVPVEELSAIARAADETGYDSVTIPDHVLDLETIETPYPYTPDGRRRWRPESAWPDPWVLVGSLAAQTTRLRFITSVYVLSLRNPFQAAKSIGTAAVLSGGRVALGAGIGWCREEFDLLEQDFGTRGRRTDEALDLMAALWQPGWTEFEGEHYTAPRMSMEPSPGAVPVYVGGQSEVALRRAARHDGWIGDMYTVDEAGTFARRLADLRAEGGREDEFCVAVALTDALVVDDFARAADVGVTDVMTQPWAYYHGLDVSLEQKLDGLHRFADEVLAPLGAANSATRKK